MRFVLLAIIAMTASGCAVTSDSKTSDSKTSESGVFDTDAGCLEGPLAQFGQYLGQWKIEDSQLAPDGSGWSDGPGARWDFACLGNGTAIQDFWMPNGGPVGTNLRTYHPETGSWDIAWAIKGKPGFAHITARQEDSGNIVMRYVSPLPDPPRQITFYPATENDWNWTLAFSFDGGTNWTDVYRIKATRIQ